MTVDWQPRNKKHKKKVYLKYCLCLFINGHAIHLYSASIFCTSCSTSSNIPVPLSSFCRSCLPQNMGWSRTLISGIRFRYGLQWDNGSVYSYIRATRRGVHPDLNKLLLFKISVWLTNVVWILHFLSKMYCKILKFVAKKFCINQIAVHKKYTDELVI